MDEVIGNDQRHPGKYWHVLDDGRMRCDLCPRDCRLHEGQRGACFVRGRAENRMVLTTYGRSSGFCIDPIEKKPLNHFYPGSSVYWYDIRHYDVTPQGNCPNCGARIAGRFGEFREPFGPKRIPVLMQAHA